MAHRWIAPSKSGDKFYRGPKAAGPWVNDLCWQKHSIMEKEVYGVQAEEDVPLHAQSLNKALTTWHDFRRLKRLADSPAPDGKAQAHQPYSDEREFRRPSGASSRASGSQPVPSLAGRMPRSSGGSRGAGDQGRPLTASLSVRSLRQGGGGQGSQRGGAQGSGRQAGGKRRGSRGGRRPASRSGRLSGRGPSGRLSGRRSGRLSGRVSQGASGGRRRGGAAGGGGGANRQDASEFQQRRGGGGGGGGGGGPPDSSRSRISTLERELEEMRTQQRLWERKARVEAGARKELERQLDTARHSIKRLSPQGSGRSRLGAAGAHAVSSSPALSDRAQARRDLGIMPTGYTPTDTGCRAYAQIMPPILANPPGVAEPPGPGVLSDAAVTAALASANLEAEVNARVQRAVEDRVENLFKERLLNLLDDRIAGMVDRRCTEALSPERNA